MPTAIHQTVDQFGLTTSTLQPYSARSKVFEDSLSIISIGAIAYAAVSLFQPIRMRLVNQDLERSKAERLLETYPGDIDDFFKLWPHDKLYYFNQKETAGLAYKVQRGVALVVSDPFGNSKQFSLLLKGFFELCFVNDWTPAFIHVGEVHRKLYEKFDFRLQKIGEEAVLDLTTFVEIQTGKTGKYFREIRNRFVKLNYSIEVLQPPHNQSVLNRLREISDGWLEKPGRAERGFMLGYYDDDYMQRGPLVLAVDEAKQIQGFINLIPTFSPLEANYDLLRCHQNAPGNCNDFLVMGAIDHLISAGYMRFNMGLSALAGLEIKTDTRENTLIDNALRFLYSNGDRFFSFSGLHRFKNKYKPVWGGRFIAYPGTSATFTRVITALNSAMKLK